MYAEKRSNDASISAREAKSVAPIEDLCSFYVDLLAEAKDTKVSVLAIEDAPVTLLIVLALPDVATGYTRFWPKFDRMR